MGQVLASDNRKLYTLPLEDEIPHKPKPLQKEFYSMEDIKVIQIYISAPFINEFPDLTPETYEAHQVANGHYYGKMIGGKKEGDGVLVLKEQYGNHSRAENHQYHYFGIYQNDQANDQGYAIFANNSICWGNVRQNQFNGNAIIKTKDNNSYYGLWEDRNLKIGHALTQHYYYVGSFQDGMRDGVGECLYHDGTVVKGVWKKDTLDQCANIIFPDGSEFSGKFYEGAKQGFGHLKTKDYEFYGDYDINVKNGLGVLIEKREDPESKNQFQQILFKITESLYVQGIPQGLFCVKENNFKKWFYKNDQQAIEPLIHIHEKRSLAEIYDQENFSENQKVRQMQQSNFEREIKTILNNVDDIVEKCEKFTVLEKHLDNQTQKLGQLAMYWDWIQQKH